MNSNLNEQIKEEVRSKADIVSVIGRYVSLKGSGSAYKGLCPFHKEKTPSFHVNAAKGFYHCFGCGKGGDVFSFLQEIEGFGFYDALTMLAEETGIELSREQIQQNQGTAGENGLSLSKTEMFAINELAVKFYYSQIKNFPEAIDYYKSRQLTGETVRDFRLGFAPPGWASLINHCQSQKIPPSSLVTCGLAIEKEGGGVYDRFRNRVIFPLCDLSGKVIGFAGRGMEENVQPKYLNSPETLLYKKKNFLYGLHKARQAVKETDCIIIVEGYMDYLAMYQAGVRNVAASSGTALTPEHASLIQRFTSKVVLLFDGDSAGQNAAIKGVFVLAPLNLDISILVLPEDLDPDDYVKKYGKDAFIEELKKAEDWIPFIIRKALEANDASTSRGKSVVVEYLTPLIQAIKNPIAQANFKKEIAEKLGLEQQIIYNRIQTEPIQQSRHQAVTKDEGYLWSLEGSFLRILVTNPEFIFEAKNYCLPETLTDPLSSDIYSVIIETYDRKKSLDGIIDATNDPAVKQVLSLLLVKPAHQDHIHEELVQKIIHLRAKFLRASIREIKIQMKNAPDKRIELLQKLKEYSTQLKELDAGE
jgi:DNA primase